MALKTPTQRSNAELLAFAQKVDANATAVDDTTGAVTTTTASWSEQQKIDWISYWYGDGKNEIVES